MATANAIRRKHCEMDNSMISVCEDEGPGKVGVEHLSLSPRATLAQSPPGLSRATLEHKPPARFGAWVFVATIASVTLALGCDGPASGAAAGNTNSTSSPVTAQSSATAAASTAKAAATTATQTASSSGTAAPGNADSPCAEGLALVSYSTKLCMSKTETTVDEYKKCVDEKKCSYKKPVNSECNWLDSSKGKHPMNCIGRSNAEEYCKTLGGRVPTVAEWEFASRDGEAKPYVWGTQDPQREAEDKYWCWSGKQPRKGTCEVGSFPAGATKSGLLDMAGNVAEWATGGDVEEKSKTCGRSWEASEGWKAMEKCPGGYFAEAQVPMIGFRCAVPVK